MFNESTDLEQCVQSELDPLIRRDVKVPTKHVARAQFLALSLSMFLLNWIDGQTEQLIPRIQIFYNVSWLTICYFPSISHEFCRWDSLDIRFAM